MAHPKGVLIERLQKEGRQPRFTSEISGPDHEPVFDAEVIVEDEVLGRGSGPNKRTAERLAAEEALRALDTPAASSSGGGGRRRGGRGRKGAAAKRSEPADTNEAQPTDKGFEGPWPVFETVLATSLRIAHDRIAAGMASDEAREAIERFALQLYKNVLQDLGEIVEEDETPA